MLGLMRGRKAGLTCDELTLGRLRVLLTPAAAAAFISCFFGTGPVGEAMALALKFGVVDPEAGRPEDDPGRMTGVVLAELLEASFTLIAVSLRDAAGRGSVTASGSTISSMGSSSRSGETRLAWPEN